MVYVNWYLNYLVKQHKIFEFLRDWFSHKKKKRSWIHKLHDWKKRSWIHKSHHRLYREKHEEVLSEVQTCQFLNWMFLGEVPTYYVFNITFNQISLVFFFLSHLIVLKLFFIYKEMLHPRNSTTMWDHKDSTLKLEDNSTCCCPKLLAGHNRVTLLHKLSTTYIFFFKRLALVEIYSYYNHIWFEF
jgi:hypothetical protein